MNRTAQLICSFIILSTTPLLFAQDKDRAQDIKKAGEALKRYMESAHPTPDIANTKSYHPMVPMVLNTVSNPSFFDNANMIATETDQLPVQNESSIAVNPINPMNLIGSAVDYRSSSSTWVYYSFDGGRTWKNTNLGKPPKMTTSSNDPSVAFSKDGTGYLVYGAFGDRTKESPENGVFFSRTTDGGVTWTKHIPVIQHLGAQTPDSSFEDKYYIWPDNSPTSPYYKRLYIPWKRVINRDSSTQIVNVYSTDNGNTWSVPVRVSDKVSGISEDTTFGQSFPLTVTGAEGEVYTIWNYGPKSSIGFAKSLDGGNTFTAPKLIQTYQPFGKAKQLDEGVRHTVKGGVRAEAYPSMTCDITNGPRRGWLYLTWSADSIPNVYFSRSTDKGETWSTPILVHSDAKHDQFWHWIAIDPTNGDLGVMYLDSRDDPNNIITNCYISYSRDGGTTWLDRRASEAQSDLRNNPFKNNVFAGDYSGCAMYDGIIYPSWVDMRNAGTSKIDNDVYTAIINTRIPQPVHPFYARPSNTDTTRIDLFWEAPKARVFGQPLETNFTYLLTRNNIVIAELPAERLTYRDTNLTAFKIYKYAIRVIAGTDTSAIRELSAMAGGARLPQMPKLISHMPKTNPDAVQCLLYVPGFRADTITPFTNPKSLIVYRNGSKVHEHTITISDTGKVIPIIDSVLQQGWYEYSFSIKDMVNYESARTPSKLAYGGPVQPTLIETFDGNELPNYYTGGIFETTTEFYKSANKSLTESPSNPYGRNERDTFMFFPVKTVKGTMHEMRFWHAALVDPSDSAIVEVSGDWGASWKSIASYNNSLFPAWADSIRDNDDWKPEILRIQALSDTLIIRYRFVSNATVQGEGWFIDDVGIQSATTINDKEHIEFIHSIHPHPARDRITIAFDNQNVRNISIHLFSMLGQEIPQDLYLVQEYQDSFSINVSSLQQGSYTAALMSDGMRIGSIAFIIAR